MVILELALELTARGFACTILTWFAGQPMVGLAAQAGIDVRAPENINAFDYDLVLLHNHFAPLLDYDLGPAARPATLFGFLHLSVSDKFDLPGTVVEPLISDRIMVVSPEVAALMESVGVEPDRITIFPNPAPARYAVPPRERTDRLRSLLVVSNHAPPEVVAALEMLARAGIRTRHVGRNGEGERAITPELIGNFDAVLTIGKTVQYALLQRAPVFVYDHFGGPGYLSGANFDAAAWANFSGRCTLDPRSAETIAAELIGGYAAAAAFARATSDDVLRPFSLEAHVVDIVSAIASAPDNVSRNEILCANLSMIRRERLLCQGAGEAYRGRLSFRKRWEAKE